MALCPQSDRLLVTAGSDRIARWWDLQGPALPIRFRVVAPLQHFQWESRSCGLFLLDDNEGIVVELPPFIKNVNRPYHCRINCIKDYNLNNWAYTLAVGNIFGEVYMKALSDPIRDEPRNKDVVKKDMQLVCKAELVSPNSGKSSQLEFASYADVMMSNSIVRFKDNKTGKKGVLAGSDIKLANYAATAVEKVAFNPNYLSCHNLVVAFRCGVIRNFDIAFIKTGMQQLLKRKE